jgi:hypothetical protein
MAFEQNLTPAQVARAWKRLVEAQLAPAGPVGLTRHDLAAAVNAVQTFIWDNRTALNQAIPQPARGVLTTDQKVALLAIVVVANMEGSG